MSSSCKVRIAVAVVIKSEEMWLEVKCLEGRGVMKEFVAGMGFLVPSILMSALSLEISKDK